MWQLTPLRVRNVLEFVHQDEPCDIDTTNIPVTESSNHSSM